MKHLILALTVGLAPLPAFSQATLELRYPAGAPGATPCIYTTDAAGITSLRSGSLTAVGTFGTGCPSGGGTALPLPVIVPGPENWSLPAPWSVGQGSIQRWSAVNAASCTYAGSAATGWPSGQTACTGTACETLKTVTITPPTAGTYTFSLVCTNATGSDTSVSATRTVAGNAVPVITAGPGTWGTLQPWTTTDTKSVAWAANDATSCSLTATSLPSGVTLNTFLGGGASSCSGTAGCATSHPLTLTAPIAGTYGLNLSCTNAVGTVTSSNSWTVTTGGGGTNPDACLSPAAGWTRMTTGEVYYSNNYSSIGMVDVTRYESVYGRNYGTPGWPIANLWPGTSGILATVDFANRQYIALKFTTPNTNVMNQIGFQLTMDATTWGLTGGGGSGSVVANMSMTVSKKCGDFNSASPDIGPFCKISNMGGNQGFAAYLNTDFAGLCNLAPNTTYYLNMIHAPLTSPASAVFNGRGPYVVQFRNFAN